VDSDGFNWVDGVQRTLPVALPEILDRYNEIVGFDSEFSCPDGHNPSRHCAVFYEFRSGRIVGWLTEDFPASLPFSTGDDALWIAYAGASDLRSIFLSDGRALPTNYLDLCVESKLRFNSPGPDRGLPGLTESLDRFRIFHIDPDEKKKNQKRYAKPELTADDKRDVIPYCETDVTPLPEFFLTLLPDLDLDKALLRGEYVKQTAITEQLGVLISPDYQKISANRKQIKLDLIAQSPVGPEIYTPKGSFNYERFGEWLKKNEIDNWVTTDSGRLCMTEEYLAQVASVAPPVKPFVDLYLALKDFKKIPFGLGPDGRSHADQQPYATITGRNAASGFVLLGPKFWRWTVCAGNGSVLINADFSNEEYAVAAFKSGDSNMIKGYALPDVYKSVAKELGVDRKVAKTAMLAIQYGASPKRLESTGIPFFDAKRIHEYHKDTYRQYWSWSDACLERLKSDGVYEIDGDGGLLHFDANDTSNAVLSARNFPIQATAAAIFRAVVLEAARQGIEIIGPLHDSILAQAPAKHAKEHAEKLCAIMREVSRRFLNGNEVRVAFHIYDDRFEDKDGAADWRRISEILKKYS